MKRGDTFWLAPADADDQPTLVRVVTIDRVDGRVAVSTPSGATLTVARSLLLNHRPYPPAGHRLNDPDTAVAAARAQRSRLTATQAAVLSALVDAGVVGMIDHDHQPVNGLEQDTAGKRRGELAALGYVDDSGRTRPSPRGQQAKVWTITRAGRDAHARMARRGVA